MNISAAEATPSRTVLLADDHEIVRQGLRILLEREGFSVVAEARDGSEAVRLAAELQPDVAILDLVMPNLNGIDAAVEILRSVPHTRPVLVTIHDEDHYVLRALAAGVKGYVLKSQTAADLAQAIHEVCQGSTYISPRVCHTVVRAYADADRSATPEDPMTPRERHVLQLIAEGKTGKEIAAALEISVKTAESHRSRIMQKLGLHDTASLVRYAVRRGLVEA